MNIPEELQVSQCLDKKLPVGKKGEEVEYASGLNLWALTSDADSPAVKHPIHQEQDGWTGGMDKNQTGN